MILPLERIKRVPTRQFGFKTRSFRTLNGFHPSKRCSKPLHILFNLFIMRLVITNTRTRQTMTEDTLVAGLLERDERTFAYFQSHYRDRIFAVARRIVRDEWDAEEVVQDVFWTVYRKIDLFNGKSAFWSWCYRITENCAKMKVRKYKRYPTPVESDVLQAMSHNVNPDDPNARPDKQLACEQTKALIQDFLNNSDETNRRIYLAMDVEGLTKEEVAAQLDLTIPALKARLHRIRFALREHLQLPA